LKYPSVVRANNDLLFGADGRTYVDLFSGHGATWLGHAHPEIVAEVTAQLNLVWLTGGPETPALARAQAEVELWFPASYRLAGFYSTGMEAAEFALRFARVATGRVGTIGFDRGMHGKSYATACLGWDNRDGAQITGFHRLPFVDRCNEEDILGQLEKLLERDNIGAVYCEPLHASGGGHRASDDFYRALALRCRVHGTLLIFDEIMTGFGRTGTPFRFEALGITPDVVLIGKAMGNGFPVSGVMTDRRHDLRPAMLAGSTFAGNPLACATVTSTLRRLREMEVAARVAAIGRTVENTLGWLRDTRIALRGMGAIWVIELPEDMSAERTVEPMHAAGVCIGYAGRQIRILPAATIEPANLERACAVIAENLSRADGQSVKHG
jgi:acetylornithine/succinyldiaminopimelate/putrescine aminotransferase